MSGSGIYVVHNNQQATVDLVDSSGATYGIPAGGSQSMSLDGAGYARAVGLFGVGNVVSQPGLSTYTYAVLGATPAATPSDLITVTGSQSKTVNVKRIRVAGVATAQGNLPVQLVRRSAANTGGASAAMPAAASDPQNPAATAAVALYTANPTATGAVAGVLGVQRVGLAAAGTGAAGDAQAVEWQFNVDDDHQPLRLRGTSDVLAINLNGATVPSGGVLDIEIETYEDAS